MFVSDDDEMMKVAIQATLNDDDDDGDDFINFPTEEDIVKEKKIDRMRSKINYNLTSMFYIRKKYFVS